MERDLKKYFKAIGIMCSLLLLHVALPHHDLSLIQMAVRPIKMGEDITLYISGLITLPFFIWCINEVYKSSYLPFGRIGTFLFFMIIGIPLLSFIVGFVKLPYYLVQNDVGSIDYINSQLLTSYADGEWNAKHQLGLKNYSLSEKTFKVGIEYNHPEANTRQLLEYDYEITIGPLQKMYTGELFEDLQIITDRIEGSASYFNVKHVLILYDEDKTVRIRLDSDKMK